MNNCRTCKHLLANYEDEFVDDKVWDICLKLSSNDSDETNIDDNNFFVKPSFGCILWDCKDNPEFTK